MDYTTWENWHIDNASIYIDDHGCFLWNLELSNGYLWRALGCCRVKECVIREVMETVGVYNWADLKGKYIRVSPDFKKFAHIILDQYMDIDKGV